MNDEPRESAALGTPACAACGDAIDPTEWHPTTTSEGKAGRPRVHVFCGEECRESWESSDGRAE